jgi:hypothetical protein
MPAPRPEVGVVVVRQPALGHALELEQEHVPRLLPLPPAGGPEGGGGGGPLEGIFGGGQ